MAIYIDTRDGDRCRLPVLGNRPVDVLDHFARTFEGELDDVTVDSPCTRGAQPITAELAKGDDERGDVIGETNLAIRSRVRLQL